MEKLRVDPQSITPKPTNNGHYHKGHDDSIDEPQFYDIAQVRAVLELTEEFQNAMAQFTKKQIRDMYKSICMIGPTGAGKSATCNTIVGERRFEDSQSMCSHTYETKGIISNWFGNEANEKILVIDTPGLGDSKGRDSKHIAEMACALQTVGYIHTFAIILNSQNPRIDDNLKAMLDIFQRMFGEDFFNNAVFVFTRWSYDSRQEQLRKIGKNKTIEAHMNEFRVVMNEQFKIRDIRDDQFCFIDNTYSDLLLNFDKDELDKQYEQLNQLRQSTNEKSPFLCKDIKAVLRDNDQLKLDLQQRQQELEDSKKQFEKESKQLVDKFSKERQKLEEQFNQEKNQLQAEVQKFKENEQKRKKELEEHQKQSAKEKKKLEEEKERLQMENLENKIKHETVVAEIQRERELIQEQNRQQQEQSYKLIKEASSQKETVIAYQKCIDELKEQEQKNKALNEKLIKENKNQIQILEDKVTNAQSEIARQTKLKIQAEDEKQKIKNTCVFCKQYNPSGLCNSRRHTPNYYTTGQHTDGVVFRNYLYYLIINNNCRYCSMSASYNSYGQTKWQVDDFMRQYETSNCNHAFPP